LLSSQRYDAYVKRTRTVKLNEYITGRKRIFH